MNPDQYRLAKELFQAAVELPADERAEFLARACAGDGDLRQSVESLLAHDAQSAQFLDTAATRLGPGGGTGAVPRGAGSRIGPYEILGPIGSGGMGDVYRAHDNRFGRDVALKLLPSEFAADPDRVARFEREARAAGPLTHSNILTVYDCGVSEGVPYLVSELLTGDTLRRRLDRGRIPPGTAVAHAAQIAAGLAVAHGRGVVHRDLKPENIFVCRDGTVKVLDFGLAKLPDEVGGVAARGATQSGTILGTFGYMSPEQVRGERATARSDIFGLGVVLYEMLVGRRPFERQTWAEETAAILTDDPPPLPEDLPELADAPSLARVVLRCLSKDADHRFESTSDLAFALEQVLSKPAAKVHQAQARSRPGRRWIAACAIVAVSGGLAVVAFLAGAGRHADPPVFQRLTFRRGVVSAARFSADGHTVVYSAGWDDDTFRLFATRTDGTESQRVGEGAAMLFGLSSKGNLAICRPTGWTQHGFIGTLASLPLSGGGAHGLDQGVSAADWAPDGESFAVVRSVSDRSQIEYPARSVVYAQPQAGGYIEALRVSPLGNAIAFLDHPMADDSAGSVAVVELPSKTYRKLSSHFTSMRGLAWSPDGQEVWFAAAKRGTTGAVWAVDLRGRERVVARFPGYLSVEDISSNRQVLLSFHALSNSLVYAPGGGAPRDLYWHDQSQVRDISRDGRSILISESGDATRDDYETYIRTVDGASPAERLGTGLPLAVSPDGQWVIANPTGSPAPLTLLPKSGQSRVLVSDRINHLGATWLPSDGKRFVFAGAAPDEGLRYYVGAVDGGPPRPITPPGIVFERRSPVVVSPDGRSAAAIATDGRITLYPVDGGDARRLPALEAGFTPLQWCPDNTLALYRYDQLPPQLWKVDIKTGALTPWRTVAVPNPVGLLDLTPVRVSPDCRSYAFSPLNVLSRVYLVSGLR